MMQVNVVNVAAGIPETSENNDKQPMKAANEAVPQLNRQRIHHGLIRSIAFVALLACPRSCHKCWANCPHVLAICCFNQFFYGLLKGFSLGIKVATVLPNGRQCVTVVCGVFTRTRECIEWDVTQVIEGLAALFELFAIKVDFATDHAGHVAKVFTNELKCTLSILYGVFGLRECTCLHWIRCGGKGCDTN